MEYKRKRPKIIMTVACPACGAAVGRRCQNGWFGVHGQRLLAYDAHPSVRQQTKKKFISLTFRRKKKKPEIIHERPTRVSGSCMAGRHHTSCTTANCTCACHRSGH